MQWQTLSVIWYLCAEYTKGKELIQSNFRVNNSIWYLDCCKKNVNSHIRFYRFYRFLYNTVGNVFKTEERTLTSGFLRTSFKGPCILSMREKKEEKLKVFWCFNIYRGVTFIRDLGYIWKSIVFNERILKSHSKLYLLLQALVKTIKLINKKSVNFFFLCQGLNRKEQRSPVYKLFGISKNEMS